MPETTAPSPNLPQGFSLPKVVFPATLPTDVAGLTALLYSVVQAHDASNKKALDYIAHLFEQFLLARRRMFGSSSEQLSAQGRLFDEAEALTGQNSEGQDITPIPAAEPSTPESKDKPARGKRAPLPPELKRFDVIHDLPASERSCCCGPMVVIGQDISEQLDIVPMQVRVLRHIRLRYGCPTSMHAPVTTPLPAQPLPKTNASADLLAMLLTVKFVDGLPLYRFGKVLDRHGATVPTQTLARWVIAASHMLQPLLNLMRDALLEGTVLHIDETVVQVLKEVDRKVTSNSYMWVQTGGPLGKPVVIFDYDSSRSGKVPVRLLLDYRGYMMADGYDGYNEVARIDGIERLACWAHVRRRFVDAVKVQPKGKHGRADEAVALIAKLYRIEREHKDATNDVRMLARQQHSVPALAALHAWMQKTLPVVTPKSALGTALSYMRDYWSMLTRFTERDDLPIDNNRAENSIRPFVVGRKSWLFSDTPAGANSSAVIYSLVEPVKANGLDPYAWLRRVLRDLPSAKTVDDVDALLPWNLKNHDLIIDAMA
jgi:transposase